MRNSYSDSHSYGYIHPDTNGYVHTYAYGNTYSDADGASYSHSTPASYSATAAVTIYENEKHCTIRLVSPAASSLLSGSLLDDHRNNAGFLPSRRASESFSENVDVYTACELSARD
jgi:hypothetical protein